LQKVTLSQGCRWGAALMLSALVMGCGSGDKPMQTNLQQEFLPVEEAFVFSAKASEDVIKVHWVIAEGYRLYKDKFKFSVSPGNYQIIDVNYPPAEMFADKNLGDKEAYKGQLEVSIKVSNPKEAGEITLKTEYQGCADVGLCYPPETRNSAFNLSL